MVELSWIATDPGSLKMSLVEQRSSKGQYLARMDALIGQGEGYTEVRFADRDYPVLTLGFRGQWAAIHHFSDEENIYLLRSAARVDSELMVSIPNVEGDVDFSGAFVIPLRDAWRAVKGFLGTGSLDGLGEWVHI